MNGQAIAMPANVDASRDAAGVDPAIRLGALFDAHHQRLFKLARRLSRNPDDARDIVQETFLRAARSPAAIPHGAPNERLARAGAHQPVSRQERSVSQLRSRLDELRLRLAEARAATPHAGPRAERLCPTRHHRYELYNGPRRDGGCRHVAAQG